MFIDSMWQRAKHAPPARIHQRVRRSRRERTPTACILLSSACVSTVVAHRDDPLPCQLPGGDEIKELWRDRPDKPVITLNPVAEPEEYPVLAMGGDCGDGRFEVVSVTPPSGPDDCWTLVPLGCGDAVMHRPLGDLGTQTFSPPLQVADGKAVVFASVTGSLMGIDVENESGCVVAMVGAAVKVEAVWVDPATGETGATDVTFMRVASGGSKWPNSPTGMPSPNQWLACACLEIEGSALSEGVKYQLKADIQECLSDHLTCLQTARSQYLDAISRCDTNNATLEGIGIGAGVGAAVGGAILMCVSAPVTVPVALGWVALGGVVVGGVGGAAGDAIDDTQESKCIRDQRQLYRDRLKSCDDATKNCLAGKFSAAGFSPNCPALWPGVGNYPPLWAPPGFVHDLPPTHCPSVNDPGLVWPTIPTLKKWSGTGP